jgi:hypothetical protein
MAKPEPARFTPQLGIIFMIVGALILLLAIWNYLQDGKISLTIVFGLLSISLGALWYSYAKKSKAQDK